MPVRLIKLILNVAIVVLLLAGTIGAGAVLLGGNANGLGQTTFSLKSDKPQVVPLVSRSAATKIGEIRYDRATIDVSIASPGYRMFQILDIVVTVGGWLLVLLILRRFVAGIAAGLPFTARNAKRLRTMGFVLIGLNLWSVARLLIAEPVLLSSIAIGDPGRRLLASISQGVAGAENLRMEAAYSPALLVVGLVMLLLADAFRSGQALREDNEGFL
ncbi:MAG: hypothetical protein ACJ8FO_06985 [Sphingomicrobium sp.]